LRPDTSLASLAALPPVFKADPDAEAPATVTAGNSSGITDGAAALVVLSKDRAAALGVRPMARVLGVAAAGAGPPRLGVGAGARRGAGRPPAAREPEPASGRLRPGRAERGVRRPGAGLRPGAEARRGAAERERRGDRPGPSDRRDGRPHLCDAAPRDGAPQGA